MPTQKFRVKGLRHEDETPLSTRIRGVEGVIHAAASHHDECAEVEFEDDRVTTEEIRAAIAEAGYDSEIAG